jgi:hypothetical protein
VVDVILIPYSQQNEWRERNLRFVVDWYRPLGMVLTLGCVLNKDGSFNRSASRNAAAKGADEYHGGWDRALIADADCVAELDVVRRAFEHASETGKLILPHDDFWRLSPRGTESVIGNPAAALSRRSLLRATGEVRIHTSMMPSGALVLTHETWDKLGGYDERLKHWGYEDSEFLNRATATVGSERLPGRLVHLWHPRDTGTIAQREADRLVASKRKTE